MITVDLALRLRDAGLRWRPASGDRFAVLSPEMYGEVFTISEMTIEAHTYPTGTILGFNGTTEWALDSVAQEDALWLPREDQLRDLLGGTFRSLARSTASCTSDSSASPYASAAVSAPNTCSGCPGRSTSTW